MTLLPLDSHDVTGVDLPRYKVPPTCCAPGCNRLSDHAHHVWRRSFLSGDFAWVKLPDGTITGNLVPLCWRHHNDVTGMIAGHKAKIVWNDGGNTISTGFWWLWLNEPNGANELANLSWQPPIHGKPEVKTPVTSHAAEGPASTPRCPGCNRPLPHEHEEKKERDPLRRRKSWTIKVPDDIDEDGALVLDMLLDTCADLFGHEPDKPNLRYFTIVQALVLVAQNGHVMLSED